MRTARKRIIESSSETVTDDRVAQLIMRINKRAQLAQHDEHDSPTAHTVTNDRGGRSTTGHRSECQTSHTH